MANTSALISIDKFVRGLLFKENKNNDDYMRYLQISCDGLRDMHMHDFHVEVTQVVTVNATTNTFPYPNDYVAYESVATEHNGKWWLYTRNDGLVPLTDDSVPHVDIMTTMPNVATFDEGGTLSSGGGTNMYYFRPDDRNRRFIVSGFTPNVVVLKYISNGIDANGAIYIPDAAKTALETYVRWQLSEYDNEPISHRQRKEEIYTNSLKKMRLLNIPTVQEFYDIVLESSGQGPKR
jgi:hypothetical protein